MKDLAGSLTIFTTAFSVVFATIFAAVYSAPEERYIHDSMSPVPQQQQIDQY